MSHRVRIAVTGLGLVTPAGLDREATWKSILSGTATARWLTSAELGYPALTSEHRWYGGRVNLPVETPFRLEEFALRAAREAVEHAGLNDSLLREAGVVIGTSKSDLSAIDYTWIESCENHFKFSSSLEEEGRVRGEAPAKDPSLQPSSRERKSCAITSKLLSQLCPSNPASVVANEFDCMGAALCPVAACATGLVSVIRAANLIREGVCNVALAGSADASLHPGLLSSYRRLGVLASGGDNPANACKPFDQNRDGFVVGEGAAVLVLEEWNHAVQRGATPLAEWIDGQISSDPTGLTSIDNSGETLTRLIHKLLANNSLTPQDIDAVSVHGTATTMNDLTEARALNRVFQSGMNQTNCFGIKGAIGHLMGAAGSVESGMCVLSLRDQTVPPTVNHSTNDKECDIPLLSQAMQRKIRTVLKISLGFGGHLAAGFFRKC